MSKILFIVALVLTIMTNIEASTNASVGFPYEEGIVKYEIFGTNRGTMVTYFCEYGKKQFTIKKLKASAFDKTKEILVLKLEDREYKLDKQREVAYEKELEDSLQNFSNRVKYRGFRAIGLVVDGEEKLFTANSGILLYSHIKTFGKDITTKFSSIKKMKVNKKLFELPYTFILKESSKYKTISAFRKKPTLLKNYKKIISTI